MAYYGYPSHPFCLPWGFDPSLLVSPDPTYQPYPQDFVIPPGYGWIPGPMMPIMPSEFNLAFLSSFYCHAHAFFLQQYAYCYPPPPATANTQEANDFVHMGIPLSPAGFPVAPLRPPYLQEVAAAGTGVFYPLVNNNNAYRARRRRGYATGRWRRNRHRRQEASRDAGASSQNYTSRTSCSQEKKRR